MEEQALICAPSAWLRHVDGGSGIYLWCFIAVK